ncbi:MAG: DUF3187 family protein [Syntrophales bacterium]
MVYRFGNSSAAVGKKLCQLLFCVSALIAIFPSSLLYAFDITPFYSTNQSPLIQIYGLPSAGSAIVLPAGGKEFRATLDQASNYVDDQTRRETILLDGETTRLTLGGRYGLSKDVEVGLAIPALVRGGGFLDGFLINYHDLFGFPQGGRDQAPRNRLLYRYSRDGVEKLRIDSSGSGIGDISLTAGYQLYHDANQYPRAVAVRVSLKLPTGDSAALNGSGSTDASVWITASDDYRLPLGHATLYGAGGVMVMTKGDVLPDQQRDYVGFGTIGAGWNPLSWIAFKVQMDAHTPFYRDSDLKALGANAAQLLIGGTLGLSERTTLDIAVSEDIATTTSPDVVFHFNLSTRF